ncbi:MAG: DNA recombination protein RmuC [Bacteroidales bacterium]|nr:DNA recombination protein RmuC [Bacteroidales bacterium]
MTEILLGILIMLAIVNVVIAFRNRKSVDTGPKLKEVETSILRFETVLEKNERTLKDEFERNRRENQETAKANREELTGSLQSFEEKFAANIKELNEMIRQKFGDFNKQQIDNNKQSTDHMKAIQETIEKHLLSIRDDNTKQLNAMRKTVDEKLQTTLEKRLGESFKLVSERLEQVHKGLGEMQNIANGVGDLKKVLSNVKTRGVLGEYALGNILEQILTPDQYGKNVATKKGSQANVEYAIKLPGKSTDEEVWMPVDSKFPIESYELLLAAYEAGIPEDIETNQKVLIKAVEGFAREISEKYIDPPHTTDFGIMFLPVESLYAEVLRHPGLFETLQRKYKITITGPTTLSALMNSLNMGFRTLAVQKRSSEVWDVLGAVKNEFGKFSEQLSKVQKQLTTASGSLETLRSTRTNQIERKLRNVETLDPIESKEVLELPSDREELPSESEDDGPFNE